MKDFYDIWVLARSYTFEDDRLARAIAATFARRQTDIPTYLPDALTPAFAGDPTKQTQWSAFIKDVAMNPGPLASVIEQMAKFLMPHARRTRAISALGQRRDDHKHPRPRHGTVPTKSQRRPSTQRIQCAG